MITLEPINDKILILPEKEEKKTTASGIFLPDTAAGKPQIAKVVSVGNGRLLDDGTRAPLSVKKNDRILFSRFAGTEIQIEENEDTYLLITERDVLAIIREGAQ